MPSHNFIMTPASPARTLTAVKLLAFISNGRGRSDPSTFTGHQACLQSAAVLA